MAQPAHSPTARERSIALRSSNAVREALDCSAVPERPSLAQTQARFRQPREVPDIRFGGEAGVHVSQARAVTQPDWAQTRAEEIAAEAREDAAYDSHRKKVSRVTVPRRPQELDQIIFDETAVFGHRNERGEGAAETLKPPFPPPPLQTTSDPVRLAYGGPEERQRNISAAAARDVDASVEGAREAAEKALLGAPPAEGRAAMSASQAFRPPDLDEFADMRNSTVLQKASLKRAGLEKQITRSYGPSFDPEARFGDVVRKDPGDSAAGALSPAAPFSQSCPGVLPLAQAETRQRENPPPGEVRPGVMPPAEDRVFGYVDKSERVTVAGLTRRAVYDDRGTVGGQTEMNSTAFQRTRYHYHESLPRSGAFGMTYGEDPAASKPCYLGGVADGSDFGVIGQLDLYRPKR